MPATSLLTDGMPTSDMPKHVQYETSVGVNASRNFRKCWAPSPARTAALQSPTLPSYPRWGAMTTCRGEPATEYGCRPGSASRFVALIVSDACNAHATRALRLASAWASHSTEQ